ncbi:MAG: DEAD/DEAH box helicase [Gammaproteobacteria bacterium]|nr:DEAD/DEAH box helicase [Gammaproteobacteria bacterium]
MHAFTLALTPHGRLQLVQEADAVALAVTSGVRLEAAFARGTGHGLLALGAAEVGTILPAVFSWWRAFAARYVTALCARPETGERTEWQALPVPPADDLDALAAGAPLMTGGEYLNRDVLASIWQAIDTAFAVELADSGASVQEFLKARHPAWNLVGRVHFNLAENRSDEAAPFAFLATYAPRLSAAGREQHVPLGQALRDYAGATRRDQLLKLLLPVQHAAEKCAWLGEMVEAGEIFHPLRWSPAQAVRLLRDLPVLEAAGVVVRMPAVWRGGRPPRPKLSVTVGATAPAAVGLDALVDFRVEMTLEGEPLSARELDSLLAGTEGLALIRGRWVEVDRGRLTHMIEQFRLAEQIAAGGVDLAAALRMLAGANAAGDAIGGAADPDWSQVRAGPWLAQALAGLRGPAGLAQIEAGQALKTTLRPYQQVGLRWLHLLARLELGGCLADDMGLGKTIQILALLLVLKKERRAQRRASLLIAPASLIANWVAEIERHAPDLEVLVAHASALPAAELRTLAAPRLAAVDLVITTYGSLPRIPALTGFPWRLAIIDEAQAIKNPAARQTRAIKQLDARVRIALTGTPVENRLSDLWSIFDFSNPGLLGNARAFAAFTKRLAARPENPYGPLRDLIRPYLLRRLKTDKSVIADLPAKTELTAWCALSRRQAALYQQAVGELAERLARSTGIERRGLVLAYLMRFKQICNHPSQWLGDGAWADADSGKLARLREIAEVIAAKQEKMLVFTQFRETTEPLAGFLARVFGRPGLVLHGQTVVRRRQALVRKFQEDEDVPFFVLSLKAGGSGLNLTAAAHVVHFDRWWNPAVENQATDRAFRIGQHRNVLVHKFVCRGTVEERIEALLESKRRLAEDLVEGGAELLLTELPDAELLRLVALDLNTAGKEN